MKCIQVLYVFLFQLFKRCFSDDCCTNINFKIYFDAENKRPGTVINKKKSQVTIGNSIIKTCTKKVNKLVYLLDLIKLKILKQEYQ